MKLFTLPNIMTLGNLFFGCFGILQVFEGNTEMAAYCILIAGLLDFLDGFVARALNSTSPIGKELDSLADVVSFGVLPSFILYFYLKNNTISDLLAYSAFIMALFSALRLAKFNIDTRQSDSFIGVPTPANALVVASFPLIDAFQPHYGHLLQNPYFILAYIILMSYLLISELPLFALKFKDFSWQANRIKYLFLFVSALFILVFRYAAIPLVIVWYIVLSVLQLIRKP